MTDRRNQPPNDDEFEDDESEDLAEGPGDGPYDEDDEALEAAGREAPLSSIASIEEAEEVPPGRRLRPDERRALRAAERAGVAGEGGRTVSDQASAVFVLVCVGVFAAIFLNGLVLGKGGFLTHTPTPTAVPSVSAGPSGSASPGASGSPAASGSAGATGSAGPSGSAAPSGSPTLAPIPTATPGTTPTAAPSQAPTAAPSSS